jgi:predicted nucleotidyltransferase
MLDDIYLTRSKIRRDILILFFSNPSKRYYVRELERLLGYTAGTIRREILKFKKDNFFLTENVGNLVYYKLNKDHPLYNEIKSIVAKTSGIVERLKEALDSIKNIDIAFIYGSFASGKVTTTSDIDVMIIGDPKATEVAKNLRMLETKFDREINFTLYTKDEFLEKRNEIEFLKEVMKKEKISLIGDIDEI